MWAVEHRIKVAAFQQDLAQVYRSVVHVRQESVLDNHAATAARFEDFDEVLKEEKRCLACANRKVLLYFLSLLAAEGWIRHHHFVAIFLLYIGEVFAERVGVDDVGRLNAMQDHVHDRDDVGERFLFLAVERAFLEVFSRPWSSIPALH